MPWNQAAEASLYSLLFLDLSVFTLFLCAVSVARAEPGAAKGSAAAFARAASFFNLIAFSLGGVFFAFGFLVALSMWFWRENCGLPPRGAPKFRVRARAGTVSPGGLFRCRCCGLRFYVGVRAKRVENPALAACKTLASTLFGRALYRGLRTTNGCPDTAHPGSCSYSLQ